MLKSLYFWVRKRERNQQADTERNCEREIGKDTMIDKIIMRESDRSRESEKVSVSLIVEENDYN